MHHKQKKGFGLLEALLAIIVIVIAGLGAYSLFDSGVKSSNITDAEDEAVQIANVYTDLASSNLTTAKNDIPTILRDSGRLSNKYFSSSAGDSNTGVSMHNAFGELTFDSANATAYSFEVRIPLGCVQGDIKNKSSLPAQFFSKVQDAYSCDATGSKDYTSAGCQGNVTPCATGTQSSIKLYFNMNH